MRLFGSIARRAKPRSRSWARPFQRLSALLLVVAIVLPLVAPATVGQASTLPAPVGSTADRPLGQLDPRFFPQTGFRIADDRILDFFNRRGGVRTFGFPVSRTFTLLGSTVQVFQRRVLQVQPNGAVGLLNVLDPDMLSFTTINGASIPAFDPGRAAQAPAVGSPNYANEAIAFVRAHAPDALGNRPVRFFTTFQDTVTVADAFPGGRGDQRLLLGFDLELWGLPTSDPAVDPNNDNFVFLRFQRGIMHFDATTGTTQGLLVGDLFKSVLTGENLPPDVAAQMAGSRFFQQYNNAAPGGLNRPDQLPNTDLRDAFIPEPPGLPPERGSTGVRFGMQAQALGNSTDHLIAVLYAAGFRWMKQQVRRADFEPSPGEIRFDELDRIIDAASRHQARLLFSVVTSPPWARADGATNGPPDDLNTFGDFVGALAERYRGRVHAYEIWNEQNLRREWAGRPLDPGLYVDLLAVAHTRIKQADPGALVISGALTPTGVNDGETAIDDVAYLQGLYATRNGAFRHLADAVGSHMAGYNNAPEDFVGQNSVRTPGFKNHPSFYFRRIDQLHDVMAANGDAREMWITEYEWASTSPPVPDGYEWTTHLSEQQVSDFYVRSIESIKANRPWVGAIFIWNLNFRTFLDPHTEEQAIFGLLDPGFEPRRIFVSLANMPK